MITAKWARQLQQAAPKHHTLDTTEHVEEVYVIGGAQLAVGAQHATAYKTETNLGPDENAQPEESIAFRYAVVPGPPPVLHVEVGASTISPKRTKGVLDPAKDPLLTAADLPISFK